MSRLMFARRLARGGRGTLPAVPDVPPPVPGPTEAPPPVTASPRLRVTRGRITGRWHWRVLTPTGEWLDSGFAPTQPQALAVGLAALDAARAAPPCT